MLSSLCRPIYPLFAFVFWCSDLSPATTCITISEPPCSFLWQIQEDNLEEGEAEDDGEVSDVSGVSFFLQRRGRA